MSALLPVVAVFAQDNGAPIQWPDLGGREVTIAMTNDYPPYQSYDENNELVGWDYDTIRDICTLINCTPTFIETSWDGMLIAIASGEFDVGAGGITYTAERDETLDFTQLFQTYDQTLLVREDEDRFTTWEELAGLEDFNVGTQIGTTNEATAKNLFGDDHVMAYETFGVAVTALLNDDVDAVVIDRPPANGFMEAQGGMKTFPESLAGIEGISFPMTPGSDLIAPFNAAISALQANGRWDEVYNKWFGEQ
ncbi:MAG: transporter substrate-binding domain-containing protein [Anaerolineae bacterium]|nr:transporter substrate-binding domain-containing protein [Anaerolineae bacterium]